MVETKEQYSISFFDPISGFDLYHATDSQLEEWSKDPSCKNRDWCAAALRKRMAQHEADRLASGTGGEGPESNSVEARNEGGSVERLIRSFQKCCRIVSGSFRQSMVPPR
jgi:hypothetical protein